MKSLNQEIGNTFATQIERVKFIRHDSLESLERMAWGIPADESLDDIEFGGETTGGDAVAMTWDEWKAALEEEGVYGFANHETGEINYWAGEGAETEKLVELFAHEIGHVVGTPLDDPLEEEARADSYADVAKLALRQALAK